MHDNNINAELNWDSDTGLDFGMPDDTVWYFARSGDRQYEIVDYTDPDDGAHMSELHLWYFGDRITTDVFAELDEAKDQATQWEAMEIIGNARDGWELIEAPLIDGGHRHNAVWRIAEERS